MAQTLKGWDITTLVDGTFRAKKKGEETLHSDAMWKIIKQIYAIEDERRAQRSRERIRKNLQKEKARCFICKKEVNDENVLFTKSDNGTTVICKKCFDKYFVGVRSE